MKRKPRMYECRDQHPIGDKLACGLRPELLRTTPSIEHRISNNRYDFMNYSSLLG
jgi:hypothetical protein